VTLAQRSPDVHLKFRCYLFKSRLSSSRQILAHMRSRVPSPSKSPYHSARNSLPFARTLVKAHRKFLRRTTFVGFRSSSRKSSKCDFRALGSRSGLSKTLFSFGNRESDHHPEGSQDLQGDLFANDLRGHHRLRQAGARRYQPPASESSVIGDNQIPRS